MHIDFDKYSNQPQITFSKNFSSQGITFCSSPIQQFTIGQVSSTQFAIPGAFSKLPISVRCAQNYLTLAYQKTQFKAFLQFQRGEANLNLWHSASFLGLKAASKVTFSTAKIDKKCDVLTEKFEVKTLLLKKIKNVLIGLEAVPTNPSLSAVLGVDRGKYGVFLRKTFIGEEESGLGIFWW
ncbi:hypothetical protein SS50377_21922 [Spironucleus salmonicida]|uniref:Uncharacterized protein n=1 Tax=Spironucleus salmonicida TaxID=348837 RepID=V6LL44_9EUKA|nr:hypothetical protein SS50377_21922 [Spironucleus salmonicida]|eukprot:EST44461.1 Hypothetical protein SS50377_15773 [Spironucleus salmonicida]